MLLAFLIIVWFGISNLHAFKDQDPNKVRNLISWLVFILAVIWFILLLLGHPLPMHGMSP